MESTPRHVVPPLSVIKVKVSCPAAVNVGAVALGHLTAEGHVWVAAPPLVNASTNPTARLLGVFVILQLVAAVVVPIK